MNRTSPERINTVPKLSLDSFIKYPIPIIPFDKAAKIQPICKIVLRPTLESRYEIIKEVMTCSRFINIGKVHFTESPAIYPP